MVKGIRYILIVLDENNEKQVEVSRSFHKRLHFKYEKIDFNNLLKIQNCAYTLNDPCKSIANDGRLTVILFFLCSLLLFDIKQGNDFSSFQKSKQSLSCERLDFVHPDKLVVDNCFNVERMQGNEFVPARYAPLLFTAMPINNASIDMLMTIKGIGPAMAEDIVAYRHQFGQFTSSMDLINIRGIGPKRAANFATVFTFAEVP